jgi:hypothetical protein
MKKITLEKGQYNYLKDNPEEALKVLKVIRLEIRTVVRPVLFSSLQKMENAQRILAQAGSELEKARDELEKARDELEKARDELNAFEALHPNAFFEEGNQKEYFTFLTQQVEKREAALKDREAALIELRNKPTSGKKRSRSASSRSGGGLSQDAFRQRVVARDKVCVISGMGQEYCQAAHIIAQCNFTVNDTQAKKLWDERFPNCCNEQDHRVMDVRNGILLSLPIHKAFDNFDLTIRKDDNVYKVETQTLNGSAEIHAYNDHTIEFNKELQHEWPREEFLKFHNECFEDRRVQLTAAAEEYGSDNEDSYPETLAEVVESVRKSKTWLSNTDLNQIPA